MSLEKTNIEPSKGVIAWMTYNRITPNLMMLILIIGGLMFASKIKKEFFPEFSLDIVTVTVSYPGSSPEEIERGIVESIEEVIDGLDGVKRVESTASEGVGTVVAELMEDVDHNKVLQDIKQEVDRITTFPEDAEEPVVQLVINRREVLQVVLHGDVSEWVLRQLSENVRDSLLQNSGITQVDLVGARDFELQVLVKQDTLRRYGVTLDEIAQKIRMTAIEIPGGYIETSSGDVLLRVKERRDWADEFSRIPIITTANGTVLYLEDISEVVDDFVDTDNYALYDGQRAIALGVYRVGKQTPTSVSTAVKDVLLEFTPKLPPGVNWEITNDMSDIYVQRLSLLLRNAAIGLVLVLCMLGLFLEFKLAFWVTMGIPISFLGAFLFLPSMDMTVNMISMFAFIIALGIVVDDAIVVGENIYEYRSTGLSYIEAAIHGAKDVAMPVTFSILTNIVAFLPMLFIPGPMGKIWAVIPVVVVTVFVISLIESLLILPSHLAHAHRVSRNRFSNYLHALQQRFSDAFMSWVDKYFAPFLDLTIKYRFLTVALGIAIFVSTLTYVASGRIGIIFFPRVEADFAIANATLPYGSPINKVQDVADQIIAAAEKVAEENGKDLLLEGVLTNITENKINCRMLLTDPEVRPITTGQATNLWREAVGRIPDMEMIRFESDHGGPGSGASITVELNHKDIDVLEEASNELATIMEDFANIQDIDDGFTPGKPQLNFTLTPEGRSLGLTSFEVARQVRNSFYGAEALRQQRGRNEVRVRVKLPDDQRSSEYDIENLLIRTPLGKDVPFVQVASIERGRAYTVITRRDGKRTVTVTANVEPVSETNRILESLKAETLPALIKRHQGLGFSFEGSQKDFSDSTSSLLIGFGLAMFAIYAMLAIPFKSYFQPLIVMVAIPFGIIGAVLGHILMGYSISLMSLMGIVALSGVVVNDSLVLISYANDRRKKDGLSSFDAIHMAGVRRFRPIMLTTMTTFGGLAPMIFETSMQAKFLIPMAISLGFGIVFATSISLVLVPCLYMILNDAHKYFDKYQAFLSVEDEYKPHPNIKHD